MGEIDKHLAELERLGLHRSLRVVGGPQGPRVMLGERTVLLLCSNNYLGLADHPDVREAAAQAAMSYGVGAGASRLVSGTMEIHTRLEERLAAFEGQESCVLFGSGYLANLGVIGALAGPGDTIFSDELNHASIVDGCRASRAQVVVYRHGDHEHLESCLREPHESRESNESREPHESRESNESRESRESRDRGRRRLIVTDSVFSMDGDVAPLGELVELAQAYDARLMVDEAHATGALGPGGRGAVAAAGLEDRVDVVIGTLGKALGSYGAYACAREEMVRYLINAARSLIFSTAPSPPSVAGALAALDLLEGDSQLPARLHGAARTLRAALAREGFRVQEADMHIVPLIVGDSAQTVSFSEAALDRGVFAQAIRPPTVPDGGSRLRVTVMASHDHAELKHAASSLAAAARDAGLRPEAIGSSQGPSASFARAS
jgi:glycine C-acetyltransferase/8-amino-7-oxononanoate synthase